MQSVCSVKESWWEERLTRILSIPELWTGLVDTNILQLVGALLLLDVWCCEGELCHRASGDEEGEDVHGCCRSEEAQETKV